MTLAEGTEDSRQRGRDLGRGWSAASLEGCGRRRRLAGQAVRRPCTHEQGAAVATCSAASRRTRARWAAAQGGAGRRALGPGCGDGRPTAGETSSAGERKKVPAMVLLPGKEEDGLGKRSNDGGFGKRRTCRCRGRRDLPRGGDGFRWRRPRWPEKLAEGSPET